MKKIQIETHGEWFYLQSVNSVYFVTTREREDALSDDNLLVIQAMFPNVKFRGI